MKPEEEIKILKKQIADLLVWKSSLESSPSIPLNIQQSFTDRFFKGVLTLEDSSKSAASETQSVNEAGSGNYGVMKPPDAFKEVTIGSTIIYIPYFT